MRQLLKKIVIITGYFFTAPFFLLYLVTRSRGVFAAQAQFLSIIPGKIGSYMRMAYYSMTLEKCHADGFVGFGSFFAHPEAQVGHGVYIGAFTILGMVKIGNNATIGSHVSILSGNKQHGYKQRDVPIQEQPREFRRISVGNNCWIGNNAVVMDNLGEQTVVAAGSVVTSATNGYEVVGGNPAKTLKKIS